MEEFTSTIKEPLFIMATDLLYVDDTILVNSSAHKLQSLLNVIIEEGAAYGLELNCDKTVVMHIKHNGCIFDPCGNPLKTVEQTIYLESLIIATVSAKPELTRRIGEAKGISKAM
eukprot:794873-Pyramimonas_sp.AAC.1